jgi:type VI secretion system secreted protein Hcp
MAADIHLEIDDIKGESQDKKFKDMIEIHSFSWGATNIGANASGGGGGSGKASIQDMSISANASTASPKIFLKCCTGDHIKNAVLHIRKQGGEQQEYYTITLEDLLVSSYQSQAANNSGVPIESFTLNFAKITFEYKPQDEKGTTGAAVKTGWNLKTNVKV